MNVHLCHVNQPRGPARADRLESPLGYLILHFRGLRAGRVSNLILDRDDPFILMTLPGEPLSFEYGPHRDEWILTYESDEVRPARQPPLIEIRQDGHWITLARQAPLDRRQQAFWRAEGPRLLDAFLHPTPANRLRLQNGFHTALSLLLDHRADQLQSSPAGRLKRLIDDPRHTAQSLAHLSRICGYTAEYLTARFQRDYHLSPVAYRNFQRMVLAGRLIASTSLSIAEIARQLNFKHVSHFSALFHKTFGYSAREALRRQRRKT